MYLGSLVWITRKFWSNDFSNQITKFMYRAPSSRVWRREGWNKAEQTKYAFAMNMKAIFAVKISQ